jgi:predicted ATPase
VHDGLPTGVVTLLFTDIESSSRLLERAGPDYGQLLTDHRQLLRTAWAEHGGVEVDTQGDSFLVAFASPRDALVAADRAHAALAAHDWRGHPAIRVRIGVHSGTPERGEEGYWGTDVHYGARLAAAGHGGQTLVSAATAGLVRDAALRSLGAHAFKDFLEPREVFETVSGHPDDHFPPPRSLSRPGLRLPRVASSFVGRDRELADVAETVRRTAGPVVLVGPGGSGKTRLAIEVAQLLSAELEDVWFVPLEGVADPDDLEAAIARALGLAEQRDPAEQLQSYLADRSALLVLDNTEHLVDAAPRISALADAGPDMRVLVTSQVRLRVADEQVVRLGPLGLPDGEGPVSEAPGVRLLLDRTRTAGHPVELTSENAVHVAELVRRLEGMPLAIELAAARLDVATPASLLRRLEQGLDALGSGARDLPARQRGLRAVLNWSCGLLRPEERDLLAALSAFAGDADPDIVELAFPGAYDGLSVLLDAGLITRAAGRVALRPPVRRYAAALVDPARSTEQHRAVVRAYAELAAPYEPLWMVRYGQGGPLMRPEIDNLLAALDWAREHDPDGHAELIAAAGWSLRDGSRAATAHVDAALGRTADPRMRARLLATRGAVSLHELDPDSCLAAAAYWAEVGDVERQVVNLIYGANLLNHQGTDPQRAITLTDEALVALEQRPGSDPLLRGFVKSIVAETLSQLGRHEEARALQAELEPFGDTDDPWVAFWFGTNKADLALADDRPRDALVQYGRCLRWCLEFGSSGGALIQACTMVQALLDLGRTAEGTLGWAVVEHARHELGDPARAVTNRFLEGLHQRLDQDGIPAARVEAANLGVERGFAWLAEIAAG